MESVERRGENRGYGMVEGEERRGEVRRRPHRRLLAMGRSSRKGDRGGEGSREKYKRVEESAHVKYRWIQLAISETEKEMMENTSERVSMREGERVMKERTNRPTKGTLNQRKRRR